MMNRRAFVTGLGAVLGAPRDARGAGGEVLRRDFQEEWVSAYPR